MSQQPTTAEQLEEYRRLVRWVLWKLATDSVNIGRLTRIEAEDLFKDPHWVANVVGEYAANQASRHTIDFASFLKRLEE